MQSLFNVDDLARDEPGDLPFALPLELTVHDRDVIAELCSFPEGPPRDEFARKALRIGVLALRQARGQLDAEMVRTECDRLLSGLGGKLDEHARFVHDRVGGVLKEYFDPESGRFQERVHRLVRQDGELERVLRRQIGEDDSQLCQTLAAHFGQDSPLMKVLSPDQSNGLMHTLRETLSKQLDVQRQHVLGQFSLDNKDGALSRFLRELTEHHGKLSESLESQINQVVEEFSLDNEESALSRLVRNVERAQRTITSEFSLDDEQSALARLKREMLGQLKEQRESNQAFQEEVKGSLRALAARREEADRSLRHGREFEDAVYERLQHEAQRLGDIAEHTGNTTGRIPHCKVGDFVVELGPECTGAGARIVVEAKERASVQLAAAREEMEKARKNRDARVGLFVFSKKTAPAGLDPLARYGEDVFIVWDAEDPASDVIFSAGLTIARAISVRRREQTETQAADFSAIDDAVVRIEKCVKAFDELEGWTTTIVSNCQKIQQKLRTTRKTLVKQVAVLEEKTLDLRGVLATATGEEAGCS